MTTLAMSWSSMKMTKGKTMASKNHGNPMAIITIAANTKQVFCISSSQLNGKRTSTEQTTNNELHDIHQITSSQKITPNRIAKD